MQDRGRAYGVYALEVKRWDPTTGRQHCWHVYRRYSDFHELQSIIKEAVNNMIFFNVYTID